MKATVVYNAKGRNYFTVGNIYDVSPTYPEDEEQLIFNVNDDEGDRVSIIISKYIDCAHGFVWELLE